MEKCKNENKLKLELISMFASIGKYSNREEKERKYEL